MRIYYQSVDRPGGAMEATRKLGMESELGALVSAITSPSDGTQVYIYELEMLEISHSLIAQQYIWRGAVLRTARAIAALAETGSGTYGQSGDKYIRRAQAVTSALLNY